MPTTNIDGVKIFYEDEGPRDGPVIVLIMGLGVQLVGWPDQMLATLHDAGLRTIRFDNRDIGLSHRLEDKKAPNLVLQLLLSKLRIRGLAPYSLEHMAADTVGLIDSLDLDRVHLVGISMGGMIGQVTAATAPERLKSFTAIMTSTNRPGLPRPGPEVTKVLLSPAKAGESMDDVIKRGMTLWNTIGTPNGGGTQEELRERVQESIQRCFYPAGVRRQLAAIVESGDLRKWSRKITAPTLVLHGTADPLIHVDGGRDVAASVEGSTLRLLEGWAHDLPPKFLADITGEIISHIRSAESA